MAPFSHDEIGESHDSGGRVADLDSFYGGDG